jgi:hypothetical protein
MRSARACGEANPQPLVVDSETVALDWSAVTVDVHELEVLAAQTTPSALAEAAALYGGDFLDGIAVHRLLAFLGRRLNELPLLLVATIREEEMADVEILRQSLDELDESGELM